MSSSMTLNQNCLMSFLLFISLFFLLNPTPCSARHSISISINSSTLLQFSSLAWDPISRHFVVGSTLDPSVYAIPEAAGTVKCLLSEPSSNRSGVSVTAVAVDHIRQRLIVAFSNRSSVAAYDLKSYKKIFEVLMPELNGDPSGVAVDLESGEVFVSSAQRGVVLKVGSEEGRWRVISEFKIPGDQGLGGLVHTSEGYIITVQPTTKKIFKLDSVNRMIKEVVLSEISTNMLTPETHAIALRTNSSIAVAINHRLLLFKSRNTWKRAANTITIKLKHGKTVVAVAMRQSTTFVLVKSQGEYWIEEVFWGEFLEELKFWGMICIGMLWFCLLYGFMWHAIIVREGAKLHSTPYGDTDGWEEACSCLFGFRKK